MTTKSFFSDQECRQVGFSEPMIETLRKIAEFLDLQSTVTTVVGPLEDLITTGLLVRTGANLWTTTALTGTSGQIAVVNGDGIAGAPTLNLVDTAVAPASYGDATHIAQFTVDQQGRLTAAANVALGSAGAQALLDSISSTRGSVLYRGASAWAALAPGASGYVLTAGGAGADPSWVAAAAGGGSSAMKFCVQGASGTHNYIWPDCFVPSTTTTIPTADFIRFTPFSRLCSIDALVIEVTGAVAATNMRAGIYSAHATTGLPDTLIEECTPVATTSTGIKLLTLAAPRAITVPVWVCILSDNSSVTIRACDPANSEAAGMIGSTSLNRAPSSVFNRILSAYPYAALPANTGALTLSMNNTSANCAVPVVRLS